MNQSPKTEHETPRMYDDEGDLLVQADERSDRVILLPSGDPREASCERDEIRIQWGQHLLSDLCAGRYRTLVCGVNDVDNSHGIIGEVLQLIQTSQWTLKSATSYAKVFHESVTLHAVDDQEPFVLKYDLDSLLILGLLRPKGRDHFTLDDLRRGFRTVAKMIHERRDRWPAATVSFLGGKSNRLRDEDGREPSFEAVLRIMHEAGYREDVYPPVTMWEMAPTAVFARYPFPESIDRMRTGGF